MNRLRIGLAVAGFVLALLSVALDDHRLAWAAIAVLAVSLLIRLVRRRPGTKNPPAGPPL